jgi:hypothetical protein
MANPMNATSTLATSQYRTASNFAIASNPAITSPPTHITPLLGAQRNQDADPL